MTRATLALDIDGTLDPADALQVNRLQRIAKKMHVDTYINTARSQLYCDDPTTLTTRLASKEKHHCLVDPDPPTSKVINMHRIQKMSGTDDPTCVMLIDDRPENIEAVHKAGFTAIPVDASTGIQSETVDAAIDVMRRCNRQCPKRSRVRLVLIGLIIICIAMLSCM